ncbi:hypothetical protein NLU13_1362 [Sarocladium strictum]|uniref:Xylanolytic transcriptional activator regulatory domain-containing protein n=1 Tax=Sarocladium strictum TaxID=5046 RepID=A0AA39LC57_SARSR|nr:hypothetical protein NLU13_1362 [Sarocladium strictum]
MKGSSIQYPRRDNCSNPTLSYTQRLEERIKELEDQVTVLVTSSASGTASASSHSSPSVTTGHDSQSHSRRDIAEQGAAWSFKGLKVDDKGAITYHGATSFFHLPSERDNFAVEDVNTPVDSDCQRRERLVSNAWEQRALENLSDIPEPYQYLLNVHWYWTHPLFHFIYRPAFTRDMNSSGPYYSYALLNAVLSHSVRWGQSDPAMRRVLEQYYGGGQMFGKIARNLVFDEISRGVCSIPTIQSLLLLSAQECGFGNSTQAWSYSGLALRLMDHMGILLDGHRFPGSVHLSDEDVEIRHRLYWSCYIWDKMISLYLGRSPSMQHTSASPQPVILDDSAENDLWTPFGASHSIDWKYPPTTSHSASCFTSMCRLALIFNDILVHMYDPLMQNTQTEMQECLHTQEAALQQWWDQLPPFLRIDPLALPHLAPPAHIVTTNCLFHTFRILLYRPMLTANDGAVAQDQHSRHAYLVECATSATAIIAMFDLFCHTFGPDHCVLPIVYSVYISASIFLMQVQAAPEDRSALRRLEFSIQCLNRVEAMSPIISSGLALLNKKLATLQGHHPASQGGTHAIRTANLVPNQLSEAETHSPAPITPPHPMGPNALDPMFQSPWTDNFGADPTVMDQAFFDNISSLSPITARLGTIAHVNDFDHVRPAG